MSPKMENQVTKVCATILAISCGFQMQEFFVHLMGFTAMGIMLFTIYHEFIQRKSSLAKEQKEQS